MECLSAITGIPTQNVGDSLGGDARVIVLQAKKDRSV